MHVYLTGLLAAIMNLLGHFALRPQTRGDLLGTGTGGGGDEGRGGGGRKSEGSTADTARKRPERPWTTARTMKVLKSKVFKYAK